MVPRYCFWENIFYSFASSLIDAGYFCWLCTLKGSVQSGTVPGKVDTDLCNHFVELGGGGGRKRVRGICCFIIWSQTASQGHGEHVTRLIVSKPTPTDVCFYMPNHTWSLIRPRDRKLLNFHHWPRLSLLCFSQLSCNFEPTMCW